MTYILGEKEPKVVLRYFEDIASLPHGSGNTKKISDYLAGFAKEHNLPYIQDERNNVIIFKGASAGYERTKTVILQAHMDMVCEKKPGVSKDMASEPIDLVLDADGDTLLADGTTLGADDGTGVAMILGILADNSLPHPPLEAVFTSDEETGMDGAAGLDCTLLKGRRMINLDSGGEGSITAGCAGGTHLAVNFEVTQEERRNQKGEPAMITAGGLRGGHSANMIGCGRASAIVILGRILTAVRAVTDFDLISASGGTKDNAIPREAEIRVLFPVGVTHAEIEKAIRDLESDLRHEYKYTDPGLTLGCQWEKPRLCVVFPKDKAERIEEFLVAFPQGVTEYTHGFKNMPQTSLNLGTLATDGKGVHAVFLIRSNINSQRKALTGKVMALAGAVKADAKITDEFPAWEYRPDSEMLRTAVKVYKTFTGKDASVDVTHAGLECGLLSGKMPGLDAIAIGPNASGAHTPDERVSIASIGRTYDYVKEILKELK